MKVYISSHDLLAAKGLANIVRKAGHKVVSEWHDNPWVGDMGDKAELIVA